MAQFRALMRRDCRPVLRTIGLFSKATFPFPVFAILHPPYPHGSGQPRPRITSARIRAWSNASGGRQSSGCHRASEASEPAAIGTRWSTSPKNTIEIVHPRGSRPGSPNTPSSRSPTPVMPVSSASSLAAAALGGSSMSTKPPGSAQNPLNGSPSRRIKTTCPSRLMTTMSAVTAGRG